MCGLCGSFTQKGKVLSKRDTTVRARVLEGLLLANQQRGTDSTGVAAIGFDGKYDLNKVAVHAAKYIERDAVKSLLRTDAPIMIGHTRMTSMGNDVTDENAHPFVEGNVIGAHNGVINNYMQIDRTVNVDSQAVFRLLDKHPDSYDYVFDKVSGSCALTWWDARDPEAMYIIAHSNPLSVAIVPRIKTVYWSSLSDHLETVMRVAYGSAWQSMEVKKDTVYRLDAEDIYQWAEWKVSFESWQPHGSTLRYYSGGGFGWDDEEWEAAATTAPKVTVASKDASPTTLPAAMSPEEEARYEAFWTKMMDGEEESESCQISSASGLDESSSARSVVRSLHDMDESGFASLSDDDDDDDLTPTRFGIDDVDGTLECGYCQKPLGQGGAWDDGLQMMICRYCQKWWDEYGHYANKSQGKYALAVYKGGNA